MVGIASMSMRWLTADELAAIRENSGFSSSEEIVFPNLNFVGLCDSGWIYSDELAYMLAALLFFIGTILAFYNSLGALAQIVGYWAFFKTFESSGAAVVGGLPSGGGLKLALISILLVATSMLFPIFIGFKSGPKGLWRRFLTVSPDEKVHQTVPLLYAASGAGVILTGLAVWTSSVYVGGELSGVLLTTAGMILLVTGMMALVFVWKAE